MRSIITMLLVVIAASTTIHSSAATPDTEAAARVDRYLEALGGRGPWAAARGEYVLAVTTDPKRPLPYTFELCWDLGQPRTAERARLQSRTQRRGYAQGSGWSYGVDAGSDAGTLRTWTAEEGANNEKLWRAAFEVVTHRLAAKDPALQVRMGRDDWAGWIEVQEQGAVVARLLTDADGAPQRYLRLVDNTSLVFGPLVDRGPIRFPKHGDFDPGAHFEVITIEFSPRAPQAVFALPASTSRGELDCR